MTDLMLAHDFSDRKIADRWFDVFANEPVIHKVGLELFLAAGPDWVAEKTARGHRIFLDLKLHDIPNTVGQSVAVACDLGVQFLTVHLSGGRAMLDAAATKVVEKQANLWLLGVSVLTSFSDESWGDLTLAMAGQRAGLASSIRALAELARESRIPGIVSSALDLEHVRAAYPDVYSVTPGIRLKTTSDHQDQKRVVTPADARRRGANAIVMGRPIFSSSDPLATARSVMKALQL